MTDAEFEAIWSPYRVELERDVIGIWMLASINCGRI
jgi:hypothetical protein